MTIDEIRKKYGINTKSSNNSKSKTEDKSTGKMTIDEIRKKYGLSSGVDQDYINSFVADTAKYSSADMADSYRVWNELDLGSRANAIRGYLNKNESSYTDKNAYKQFSDAIDSYLNIGKEYSTFADEKAYGDWYKSYQASLAKDEEMRNTDLEALAESITRGEEYSKIYNEEAKMIPVLESSIARTEQQLKYGMLSKYEREQLTKKLEEEKADLARRQNTMSMFDVDALNSLSDKKAFYEDAKRFQEIDKYKELTALPDFTVNSQYDESNRYGDPVPAVTPGQYTDTGYTDIKYAFINGDLNARSIKHNENASYGLGGASVSWSFYEQMTPEEVSIFNYLYNTQSPEEAYKYVDLLSTELNYRDRMAEQEKWESYADESPALASIFSVLTAPLKGVSYVGQVADYIDDGKIDENAAYNKFSYMNSAIRNQVASDVERNWGKVGSFAYQTGMSMADFLFTTGISGGSSAMSLAIMGTGAAADSVIAAKDRGLSDGQAFLIGTIAGAAEIITEKYSLEALLDTTKLGENALGYLLKNVLAEGSEEVGSSLINLVADVLISRDKSEWQAAINAYMAENPGANDKEAFWHVMGEQALSLGLDFLGGAISGGAMGGGAIGINALSNNVAYNNAVKQHGQSIIDKGGVDPLKALSYEVAKSMEKKDSKEINRLANKVEKKASARNVGKLSAQLEGKITKQNRAAFESALEKNGLSKKEAKLAADYLLDSDSLTDAEVYEIEHNERFESAIDAVLTANDLNASEGIAKLGLARNGKTFEEVLNSSVKNDTINESEANTDEGEGIHLRDSSERNDGENTEGSVFDLESSTGKNQSWRKAEQFADGEAARLVNEGREVIIASLGVLRGSKNHTVRLLDVDSDPSLMTPLMKKAYAKAKARGLNLKFFVGDNLVIADEDGKLFAARGYIVGNTMLVRADHPYYTADQITRHEIGHYMIAKGEVDIEAVRKRLVETIDKEDVDTIAKHYADAYKGTNLTAEEIWEECICDSLGDMNIFANKENVSEYMKPAMAQVKSATESTTKSPTQTRGSPEGKASYQFWYPNLTQREWNLLNRTLNKELTTTDNFIDEATKWLYADEKGVRVFAIYGIGDGTEATVLYAVGGIKAQNLNQRRIDYESGKDRTKRNSFKRNLDRIRVEQNKYGNSSNRNGQDVNETTQGVGTISLGPQRGDNGGRVSVDSTQVKFSSPEEAKDSGKISDAKFSIEFADDIANKQRKYAEDGLSRISSEELEQAIADTAHMVNEMKPYANILPQDKVGKTLVKNGSYDVSVENTTVCIRTLAYNSFVDMVSEKVGRPLTQMESFLVSQKLYEIAKEPQCLYCYVSLDRKAFNEMVIRYTEQRDAAIKAYEDAGKPKIPSKMDAEWSLFKEFLDGRKPTTNMWDRYVGWLEAYNNGETLVSLSDISTEARRLALVENGGEAAAQVKDILKYAQSASWAKKQTQYVAYNSEILKLKPQVIRNLNSHYGMRWYSFSDYSGAFIVENMQQITDAAVKGLKGLSYTKDTDFAEIFAPTGMNINISVYATKTANGYEIDAKQSANIDEAIKLREKYPNVGIVVVATDKGGVEWALAQEWSDVVIPFHTVRTGADVAEFYNWEIFNAEQSDTVTDQNLWDAYLNEVGKKKASKNVYPSEHQNNKDTYLAICEKRGLTPRFKSFLENPNYMKLVNETRQSEGETSPLKAKFDVDAAERSFDKFVEKGGYYEGWYNDGIDVDGEAEIVAEDVRAGRKANEVSYGRQDINFEDIAKGRKTNREHGHASRELDVIDYIDEQAEQEGRGRAEVANDSGSVSVREIEELLNAGERDIYGYKIPHIYKGEHGKFVPSYTLINPDGLKQDYFGHLDKDVNLSIAEHIAEDIAKRGKRGMAPPKESSVTSDPDSVSNREILADALESVAKDDTEKKYLGQYKDTLYLVEGAQKKLAELRADIAEIKFSKSLKEQSTGQPISVKEFQQKAYEIASEKGIDKKNVKFKLDTNTKEYFAYVGDIKSGTLLVADKTAQDKSKLALMEQTAANVESNITKYDEKLLRLEALKPIKDILARERAEAYREAKQAGKEKLDAYREKSKEALRETMEHYQEARRKNVEGRRKTEMRYKIKNVAHDLESLLEHGTKERNVKKGQSELVRRVLDLSDMLFATDDELIVGGIETDLSDREKAVVEEFKALYDEYHSYDESVTKNKEKRKELRTQMNEKKKALAEALERERKRISKAKASGIFDALAKEYEALKNSEYSYIRNAFNNESLEYIKKLRDDVGDTVVKDMTLGQLESVYKALRMVKTMVSESNKLFNQEIKESVEKAGQNTLREVQAHGHKYGFTKAGKEVSKLAWNNLKPIYLMERIGSKTLQNLFQNILNAESEWAKFTAESHSFIEEQKKKFGYDKWDLKKKWTFKTETGLEYELNLEQMFSIYAYAKRGEQALNHLRGDGFVFDKVTVKKKGVEIELNDKTAYKVTDAVLGQIFGEDGILTEDQKAFVDAMQKYLSDDLAKRGNAVSNKLYGIDLFGEEYYLSIRSEGAYLERAREQNNNTAKMKNRGFTKSTQKNSRNAIVLSEFTDLWSGHVIEMNEYAAFTLPLEDFYRVYNYQNDSSDTTNKTGVIPAIDNAYGDVATKAIDRLLEDINGGVKTDYVEGAGKKLMGLFKKAKVMMSLSVIVQQPSAIVRAMSIINPKYFIGEKTVKTEPKLWEEVKKYAPVAIIKEMGYFDTGLGYTAKEWVRGNKTFKDRVDDIVSWAPAKADEITWRAIWKAVKRETLHNNPKMNPTSEEFLTLCGKRFEEVIRLTQVYDSTLSRSANMRNKNVFMQMVTAFMAEPTTSINMLEMAVRSKNGKRIRATIAAVYGSYLLNAILVALPYAMRDDDEDETFAEKYLSALTESFISNAVPLTALPFVKDIWSIAQGYDVERADMSLIGDLIDSIVSFATESMKEDSDPGTMVNIVVDFVGTFANLTGIPLKNLVRDVKGIINAAQTITKDFTTERNTTWKSLGDALEQSIKESTPIVGRLTQESKADKLFDAIVAGDKNYTERLKNSYSSESAYESAIRSAIGERYKSGEISRAKATSMLTKYGDYDENDAYWKLKEWDYKKKYGNDAEWTKYNEFYTAVKTGKNLKAVIKDYTDHGVSKETLASQITSYYKPMYKKMSKAQRASLKGYLLNAYQLLGYKRADKSKDIDNWLNDK